MLVPRREVTGADRQWAERYDEGDVLRYSRGSKALGIEAGDYARVEHVDAKTNRVTVRTDDDRSLNTDPRRLQGVTRYREGERALAAGDRVEMTAPDRERGVPTGSSAPSSASTRTVAWRFGGNLVERPRMTRANAAISITATP